MQYIPEFNHRGMACGLVDIGSSIGWLSNWPQAIVKPMLTYQLGRLRWAGSLFGLDDAVHVESNFP